MSCVRPGSSHHNRDRSCHLGTRSRGRSECQAANRSNLAAYHDAWNNHNAAGIAGLYTKDAILVTQAPQIVKNGQQDIEQNYQKAFATIPHHDSATADQIAPLGADAFMSVGEYHLLDSSNNKLDGHWTAVYVPEAGKLKIRMLTAVPDVPPAPTAR